MPHKSINIKTRLSSIESQPKKVDVVVVFIDGLVFVVDVILYVGVSVRRSSGRRSGGRLLAMT